MRSVIGRRNRLAYDGGIVHAAVGEVFDQRPVEAAIAVECERTVEHRKWRLRGVAGVRASRGVPGVNGGRHLIRVISDEAAAANALEASVPAAHRHPHVDAYMIAGTRSCDSRVDAARRTTGVGGNPGNGGGIWPLGVLTALFIVVFGSETEVRLAQGSCAASALEARAKSCADGAMNVLATATAAVTEINFCNMANNLSPRRARTRTSGQEDPAHDQYPPEEEERHEEP